MHKKLMLLLMLSLLGCSSGDIEQVKAAIIHVEKNTHRMNRRLSGPDYSTTVRTADGFTDSFCGYAGEVGDEITGYWVSGSWDGSANGFSLTK